MGQVKKPRSPQRQAILKVLEAYPDAAPLQVACLLGVPARMVSMTRRDYGLRQKAHPPLLGKRPVPKQFRNRWRPGATLTKANSKPLSNDAKEGVVREATTGAWATALRFQSLLSGCWSASCEGVLRGEHDPQLWPTKGCHGTNWFRFTTYPQLVAGSAHEAR